MVIDCTPQKCASIRDYLESEKRAGVLYFGMHESDSALMTCFLQSFDEGGHIHFVDGSDGGYAIAAKGLKAQISRDRAQAIHGTRSSIPRIAVVAVLALNADLTLADGALLDSGFAFAEKAHVRHRLRFYSSSQNRQGRRSAIPVACPMHSLMVRGPRLLLRRKPKSLCSSPDFCCWQPPDSGAGQAVPV